MLVHQYLREATKKISLLKIAKRQDRSCLQIQNSSNFRFVGGPYFLSKPLFVRVCGGMNALLT